MGYVYMTPSTSLLLLGAALLTFGSCKTPSGLTGHSAYSSTYYQTPWKAYATFYINPASETGPSLTALNQKRMVGAVRAGMIAKGLTRGDATADLVVNIVSVDTSRAGQLAGRPNNEWFRLFHGGGLSMSATSFDSIRGSLLPDSGWSRPKGAAAKADSVRAGSTSTKADTSMTASAGTDSSKVATQAKGALPNPATQANPYVYGALIIEVIDTKQRILLWEGVANRPLDVPMKDPDKRIPAAIGRLLQKFSLTN